MCMLCDHTFRHYCLTTINAAELFMTKKLLFDMWRLFALMLEQQGKDAPHNESHYLYVIYCCHLSAHAHTHGPSFMFCQECSCVCCIDNAGVCVESVTCEGTDME